MGIESSREADNAARGHSTVGNQSKEEVEHDLLALISAGDRCALDKLYILYFAPLANFFWILTTRSDLAEELIHDTMFEVWRGGVSIGASASVSLAIMRLAYSLAQKRLTATIANQPHTQPAMHDTDHDSPTLTILDAPSNPQVFLSKLPFEEKAVVYLAHASGHSRREIADIMNISCESVDVLIGNARLRLRR
jgi:DNA-directed RNA polymerase specialized sigma24 family protein